MFKMIQNIYIYVILAMLYYLSPLWSQNTGIAFLVLFVGVPLAVILLGLIHCVTRGFKWYFCIISGLLWLPNILLMNESVAIYAYIYGVFALFGQVIAVLIKKVKSRKKEQS